MVLTDFLTIKFLKMKVEEKSNGTVQGTAQRREEAGTAVLPKSGSNPSKSTPLKAVSAAGTKTEGRAPDQPEEKVKPEKPALNLETTLKVVEDLHRRSIQRDNLLSRIRQLEAFEIAQMEESDELESNHFQGCQLIIGDDKGRKFITQTAGLIKLTAEFIRTACIQKLGEIEADIVLPRS